MRKIYYLPFESYENDYCNRMKYYLSNYGLVVPMSKKNFIKSLLLIRDNDFIFLNWFENQIVNNTKFSILGFLKVFFVFLLCRMSLGKFVYVKHNNYPHDCSKKDILKATWAISVFEKMANIVVVHSLTELNSKRSYIPHPLYESITDTNLLNKGKSYIIFGRIVPYKKIEKVIEIFPSNKKLIIAGICQDSEYLNKLVKMSESKTNIEIIPKFLTQNEVKSLVEKSAGMLITHNDDDMIVSGSFFYAMTLRSKVYALETPFFRWAEEKMGSKYIETFSTLNDLEDILNKPSSSKQEGRLTMIDLFGETAMNETLYSLFNGEKR